MVSPTVLWIYHTWLWIILGSNPIAKSDASSYTVNRIVFVGGEEIPIWTVYTDLDGEFGGNCPATVLYASGVILALLTLVDGGLTIGVTLVFTLTPGDILCGNSTAIVDWDVI